MTRIAIIGGESTGKTTLATDLARRLHLDVLAPLKPSVLAESGYHTIFEWAGATNGWASLLERQVERERSTAASVIDEPALQVLAVVARWGWNHIAPDRFELLRAGALRAASSYDHIVLTPARLAGGPAPGRFRNQAHNEQLTRLLEAFVREAGLAERVVVVAPGPIEEQCAAVARRLG